MEYLIVPLAAFAASALTLFSGFGLGTLLMPVVAIFFPIELAVAITAVVHLANNLFKVALLGRQADRHVLLAFGVPAVAMAFIGALALGSLADLPAAFTHDAFGSAREVTPVKFVVGALILVFVALELSPAFSRLSVDRKYLPAGGAISGFFGGLSGHQGAFRSMFLLKAGLTKESFIATGVMLAVMVDVARLAVYGRDMLTQHSGTPWDLVACASLAAFAGAWGGAKLLNKVTIRAVQLAVSALLVLVGLALVTGLA